MTLSVPDAQIRTLADYLRGDLAADLAPEGVQPIFALAHIAEGWESQKVDLRYPTLTIDAPVSGQRFGRGAYDIEVTQPVDPANPDITVLVSIGMVSVPLQVNIFADSREQRSEVCHALEVTLQANVVNGVGLLRIASPYYHNLCVSYWRDGTIQYLDTENAVGGEEWRAVLTVQSECHEVVSIAAKRFIDLGVDYRVATAAEIDLVVGEVLKVFEP